MKKALVFLSAMAMLVAMVGLAASWFWDKDAVAVSAAKPWPGDLGTLDSTFARFPPLQANEACGKLTALGKGLPKSQAVDDFVRREIARGEPEIGEPPVLSDVSAIRELLLREPLVCETHEGIGGPEVDAMRSLQMTLARALAASALAKVRAGDPAAWEDLEAVWILARSLDGNPQMMMQTAALSMTRMINAVAWKMPLPAPTWLRELQERDSVPALLAAFQHQAASYWRDGSRWFPNKWLAQSVEHDRLIAEGLFNEQRCEVSPPMNELGTDLTPFWNRAFRYRAEREATANALRVREGMPIQTGSRCSDGGWSFDGKTLRFSREIASAAPDTAMPLTLRVMPPAQSLRR